MLRKFEPYFGDFLKKLQPDHNQKFSYKKKNVYTSELSLENG